ncbi:diacylglycerol kinase family protein [Calderihabitans maritimus]|uniref:Diacylglycerol kinase n=1 Tax=Calderihabitans maritimus TaxID=1246530 RepID=A0A1Z5HVL0_9FIRM|nr:diacylglycerol kinase family protein [Calderihabitans maritimus]GAW93438.1 diacylglycerol kinase [Calderihabitans maritimus]
MFNRTLKESFQAALAGIIHCLRTQRNMRIHFIATLLVIVLAAKLGVSKTEGLLLLLTIAMVWVCEIFNTALEIAIDMYTSTFHPLARIAKNVAAGAVLVAAMAAVIMGIAIFYPKLKVLLF